MVLKWLALGVFINAIAQTPYAALQGAGRPDLIAGGAWYRNSGDLATPFERFVFDDESLAALRDGGVVHEPTLEWLAGYRFTGDVWGYPEGEVYFPYSPLMVVESTFAEAVLLETLLLSILNHDSAIASAASRMTWVSCERPCIEMGSRRTHEEAAVAAARAAYVAGFSATSNLAARQRYGVPTTGTSAHSFTLLHDTERDAFTAQVESLGKGTSLLIDTYDITEAVTMAVKIAGPELGAVRIDSGDLGMLAQQVREQLDSLGATRTRVIVTSDLDEYAIAYLRSAPVDSYGVGTRLVTGSGANRVLLVFQDLKGSQLYQSPENKFAFNANYTFEFEPGNLILSGTYTWTDSTIYQPFRNPAFRVPSYGTADFRAIWNDGLDRFSVIGFVKNAFDEEGFTSTGSTNPTAIFGVPNPGLTVNGQTYLQQTDVAITRGLIAPRTYGLELQYRF